MNSYGDGNKYRGVGTTTLIDGESCEWLCKKGEADNSICDCAKEPVAYATHSKYRQELEWNRNIDISDCERLPLYIHPQRGLSDEEIADIAESISSDENFEVYAHMFARALLKAARG